MSPFKYDKAQGRAEATLYSMFKFPESNRVHFQCDILVCKGNFTYFKYKISVTSERIDCLVICILFMFCFSDECPEPVCDDSIVNNEVDPTNPTSDNQSGSSRNLTNPVAQGRSFQPRADALLQPPEDGALMASYSVFVVEPGAPGNFTSFFLNYFCNGKFRVTS